MHLGESNFRTAMLMPDGAVQELPVTDQYGLPCDPKFYAKPSCSRCYGRGVVSITHLVTVSDDGLRTTSRGPNLVRCGCVGREYERAVHTMLVSYPELAKVK